MRHGAPLQERFWAKVERRKSGCWEWIGSTDKQSYGRLWVGNKLKYAHRVSWLLHYGSWPTKDVLHDCDNPPCIRPDHLYEGTDADNVRDCKARGRNKKGEQHGNSRLTAAKVRVIRLSHLPNNLWAKKFGVSKATIQQARTGLTWQHIKNPPPIPPRRYEKC